MIKLNGRKVITIIYDESVSETVREISDRLQSEHLSEKKPETPPVSDSGFITECHVGLDDIADNSAVIFVTNDLLENSHYRDAIQDIPEDYRLIPVGYPRQITMSHVPPRLADINFVIPNDYLFENIRDSLTTDPAFYSLKNQLILKMNQWKQSKSDAHLLTDRKDITRYREQFTDRYAREHDRYFRNQITEILEYLDASMKYSRRIQLSAILRWSFRLLLVVLSIVLLTELYPRINRAEKRNTSASVNDAVYGELYNALFDIESVTSPYHSADDQLSAYNRLLENLNHAWPLSPLASDDFSAVTDAAAQYVWTADKQGTICIWDAFTGNQTEKHSITDCALQTLSVSDSQETAAAVDENGEIYLLSDRSWNDTGIRTAAKPADLQCSAGEGRFIIYDSTVLETYTTEDQTAVLDNNLQAEHILSAALTDNGELCWAELSAGKLIVHNGTKTVQTEIDAADVSLCTCRNTDAAVCLKNGQVYYISGGEISQIPLMLKDPSFLMPVGRSVILYHDRILGTHFYDVKDCYDYGQFFQRKEDIRNIWPGNDLIMFDTGYMIIPFTLKDILPADESELPAVTEVFSTQESKCEEGLVSKAEITDHHLIVLESSLAESGAVVLDPAGFITNNAGYINHGYEDGLPDRYSFFEASTFYRVNGIPETIGVRYEAANELNDHDFSYILIGMDNGTFAEFGIDNSGGAIYLTALTQIPSHSAVVSINVTDNGYLLEDETGRFWPAYSGINLQTESGVYRLMSEKIHCAIPEDILDELSDETVRGLKLQPYQGSRGKG